MTPIDKECLGECSAFLYRRGATKQNVDKFSTTFEGYCKQGAYYNLFNFILL